MKFATKITEPTDATYRELLDLQYRGEIRGKEGEVGRYTEKRDEKKIWNFCNTIGKKFIICTSWAKGFLVEGLFPLFTPPLRF